MTTLFDDEADGPRTHLFTMGVGTYRHLAGGDEPLDHLRGVGLGQLSSPPLSARAVTDWFIAEMDNPDAPLGSVELLLSPSQAYDLPDGRSVEVEAGTIDNLRRAFDAWFARCDRHEGNVAILSFCGHGLMREVVALLAEDFGRSAQRPFEASVDFTMTFEGMATCRARRQLYVVDACRQVMRSTLALQRIDATALAIGSFQREYERDAPILYASAEDDRAYARAGHPTRLTEALLRGLRGLGSEIVGGGWVVTSRRLLEATSDLVVRENLPDAPMQRPRLGGESAGLAVPLHRLPGPPKVPVTIECLPGEAMEVAELSLVPVRPGPSYGRGPSPERWTLEVEPGDYDAAARFSGGDYPECRKPFVAMPPPPPPFPLEVG
ncbi:MAG TPA: caspase family protein [Actinomycetota bacterium]